MRIVHIVDRLDPSGGGAAAVAVRLAASHAIEGHHVTIAAHPTSCTLAEISEAYDRIPGFKAVHQHSFGGTSIFERFAAVTALRSMAKIIGHADFVHVHGIWRPLLLRAAQYCHNANVPYAITPHGMLNEWAMSQKRVKKTIAMRLGWRNALTRAAFLHFLSSDERDDVSTLGLATPAVILPNGISVSEMSSVTTVDRAFAAALPKRYVLFLARLQLSKGLDVLCAAFDRLAAIHSDLHLVIAGPDFGFGHQLRDLIGQSAHKARAHQLGGVYGANKLHLLRNALCLCHPTRHEAFSITILEALASALPVVTTAQSHFPELQDAGAGYITELVPEALCEAVNRLVLDSKLRARMGAAGQQLVAQHYDWSAIALAMTQSYNVAIRSKISTGMM
jgi:glycosyltransferase involved in cell wall biosynthesis